MRMEVPVLSSGAPGVDCIALDTAEGDGRSGLSLRMRWAHSVEEDGVRREGNDDESDVRGVHTSQS